MNKLLFLILLFLCELSYSQQKEFVFNKFTRQNGLASSNINRLLKDSRGYYWFGSASGLQRFDGSRMITFQHDPADSLSLPDNQISFLTEDNKRRLWISSGKFPCIYEPVHRKFIKVPVDIPGYEGVYIRSFYEDSKGLFWMATVDYGLFVLDTVHMIFKKYTAVMPPLDEHIYSITEDTLSGFYWISTKKGVVVYDTKSKVYYTREYNPRKLRCLMHPAFSLDGPYLFIDHHNIWFQIWDPGKGFIHFRYNIRNDSLKSISLGAHIWGFMTDASGTVWAFGNMLGYYSEKSDSFTLIPPRRNSSHGIDFNEIYYMYRDSENNLWLLTNLGVYFFNPQQQYFTTITSMTSATPEPPIDPNINGFIETRDGKILALGWGGDGIYFFDPAFNRLPALYGYSPGQIKNPNYKMTWCGLQDSKGIIWVGAQAGHIIQIDPVLKKTRFLTPPEFENRTVRSITEDKNGNIWLGTQNNIIVKWVRTTETFKQITPLQSKKYKLGWIVCLLPGNDNDLWAATLSGGLLHIDCGKDEITEQFLPDKKNRNDISNENTKSIIRWNADTLIVATAGTLRLFSIRSKAFSPLADKAALPAEGIVSMIKDENNNLWFSSVNGISKIHLPDKRVYHYGAENGITELDFQLNSVSRFSNNRIAFGNTRGWVSFYPGQIQESYSVPANVSVTGFKIPDTRLSVDSLFKQGNKIRLKYSQNYFTIEFASLSNVFNNRPRYYYQLEGADKDWVPASDKQEAIYTYLGGGNYTFRVKCISPDGMECAGITSFKIHIAPPFYLSWWFIIPVLVAIVMIAGYIFRLRMRQRKEREIIRNRIARDLHDDMGSTLSTINILSAMAKSKLHSDEMKAGEYINKISDNSQQMMEAMDDIVWAIRPDNDSMHKMVARMREFATGVLEAKDIEIDFRVGENVNELKLAMEQRRDFFLVFKEAVNNAAKYSGCHKVIIQVANHQKRLVLVVEDDGKGFDPKSADSGNGLGNMQKRAGALRGRLHLQSHPGQGTRVILNIPAA